MKKSLWKCIFQIQHSVNSNSHSNSQKLFLTTTKTIMAEILPKSRKSEEQNEGETIPRMIWVLQHQ